MSQQFGRMRSIRSSPYFFLQPFPSLHDGGKQNTGKFQNSPNLEEHYEMLQTKPTVYILKTSYNANRTIYNQPPRF